MIKIVLLGAGNVAVHLAKAFERSNKVDFVQRYSRSDDNDSYFNPKIPKISHVNNLAVADVYILAINDDSISKFSHSLPISQGLLVHTSGSVSLEALSNRFRRGVFYPLQSFSKNIELDFKTIPVALETEFEKDKAVLNNLASSISDYNYIIDSAQREKLHIAAVFANNFSNYMFSIAKNICDENNLPFDILKPLILETANKLNYLDPQDAQTGPAIRNDKQIIQKHLSQLKNKKKEIYNLISESIIESN